MAGMPSSNLVSMMGGFTAPAPPLLDLATSEGLPLINAQSLSNAPMMVLPPLVQFVAVEPLVLVQLVLALQALA